MAIALRNAALGGYRCSCAIVALCFLLVSQPFASEGSQPHSIMFTGHSLLDNPLPDFFETIARSKGKTLAWEQQNIPGSPLRIRTWGEGAWSGYRSGKNHHGGTADVLAALSQGPAPSKKTRFDTLIVTERHDILGTIEWENTIGYLRHFHDRLIEQNSSAKSYFYQSWLSIDRTKPSDWIDYEKNALVAWQCVASKVNFTVEAANRADRIDVLPAGAGLAHLIESARRGEIDALRGSELDILNAVFRDDVHLTPAGNYFVASLIFAVIYKETPVGAASVRGVSTDLARSLQDISWRIAEKFDKKTRETSSLTMEQCRERIVQDVCPRFWTMVKEKRMISPCRAYFGDPDGSNGNPFVWPDPNWKPLPDPT